MNWRRSKNGPFYNQCCYTVLNKKYKSHQIMTTLLQLPYIFINHAKSVKYWKDSMHFRRIVSQSVSQLVSRYKNLFFSFFEPSHNFVIELACWFLVVGRDFECETGPLSGHFIDRLTDFYLPIFQQQNVSADCFDYVSSVKSNAYKFDIQTQNFDTVRTWHVWLWHVSALKEKKFETFPGL